MHLSFSFAHRQVREPEIGKTSFKQTLIVLLLLLFFFFAPCFLEEVVAFECFLSFFFVQGFGFEKSSCSSVNHDVHVGDMHFRICFPFAIQYVCCMNLFQQKRPSKRASSNVYTIEKGTNTQCMLANVHVVQPGSLGAKQTMTENAISYAAPIEAFFCPEIRAFTGFGGEISSTVSKVLSDRKVRFKQKLAVNGR